MEAQNWVSPFECPFVEKPVDSTLIGSAVTMDGMFGFFLFEDDSVLAVHSTGTKWKCRAFGLDGLAVMANDDFRGFEYSSGYVEAAKQIGKDNPFAKDLWKFLKESVKK